MHNCDLSAIKLIPLGEMGNAELRFEAFNAVNPGTPDTDITNRNAGRITSISGKPRELQLAPRITF